MEKWKSLKKIFIEDLAKDFESKGFEWLEDLSQFRKKTSKGFINFVLSFSDYPDLMIFEGHAGLRIDAIEEMAYPFTNGLKSFQPDSHTLISSIGRLKGKRFERHTISSEEELGAVLTKIRADIKVEVESFWTKYQDLENLRQLFNYTKEDQLKLVQNWNYAPLRGIVVAKILNSSDLEALIIKHRAVLKELSAHDVLKERFEQLAVYLQEMSMN